MSKQDSIFDLAKKWLPAMAGRIAALVGIALLIGLIYNANNVDGIPLFEEKKEDRPVPRAAVNNTDESPAPVIKNETISATLVRTKDSR